MNSDTNTHNVIIQDFRQSMQAAGINYSGEIVADGRLHRIRHEDHKNGTLNCAYVLHIDNNNPAGYFENWSAGTKQTWTTKKINRSYHAFSDQQIKQAKALRQKEQLQKYATTAIKAVNIWNRCKPIAKQSEHAYLKNKRIQPHGARLYHDALVIPIFNESDQLVNLQFINLKGEKRFLSGGRKRGCFHIIGDLSQRILICEGFATGASLYEDCGQRTVIAFDAGNLLPVAKNIRELTPNTEIIICGDNDLSGAGQAKAREAALSIGGKILIPGTPDQDWNDVLTGGNQYA